MVLSYVDVLGGGKNKRIGAKITTDHCESRYGLPVVVLPDGGVLSPESWVLLGYAVVTVRPDEAELMTQWLQNVYAMYNLHASEVICQR